MEYSQPLMRYTHTNNSLLSSSNTKKSTYEPRTEAISPAINDDILNADDSTSQSTKDEQTLIVEKLKKVELEISQTSNQISRLRKQKEQLEQAANRADKNEEDQENVCDTKQLSIAKLVYHENRAKAQRTPSKLDCLDGIISDLPLYNQPTDNAIYHHNTVKFNRSFKASLVNCFKTRITNRVKLEDSVSAEYDRRMEKWLKSIEIEDSQPNKRIKDAKAREFFEKQFPELKKARESGERFSRVGQRVARSDAEVAELMDGITEREDQDKKVKSYAVIPPMLEEMRSRKPKFINTNGYVDDIVAEYKEYQILNTWTDDEKDIFKENYLQHPKDFGLISRMTTRKNVANCVQYYYLSKKSENYKQLLKRQQKRRTRSFVRPAQATPANPSVNESNNDKCANGNDKQACDSTMTEVNNGSETNEDLKQSASKTQLGVEGLNSINHGGGGDNPSPKCCICECNFGESNQFRNVTRSNHQIYGIGVELLKPGLKICYSCRFRHVTHPSFDDPSKSPDPMDDMNDEQPSGDIMMDVDTPDIKSEHPNSATVSHMLSNSHLAGAPTQLGALPLQTSPTNNQSGCPDNGDTPKGAKRTCVRDIIYQAIEMSFQKQDTSDETQPKLDPIRPECTQPQPAVNPILPQHPIPTMPGPLYGLPPHYRPPMQPIQPVLRHRYLDESTQVRQQQQYHMQNLQQQQPIHQQHLRQPFAPIVHRPLNPTLPPAQHSLMNRLPGQPFQTTSSQPSHLTPVMQPVQMNSLLSTVVPISSPHMAPTNRHSTSALKPQPPPQPVAPTQNHMLPGTPLAHPLNLCRKYSDPILSATESIKQQQQHRPPAAHSGKASGQAASGSVDDGVLNLSSKTNQSPSTTPQPNQPPPPLPSAPVQQKTTLNSVPSPPTSLPSAPTANAPTTTRVSPPQSAPGTAQLTDAPNTAEQQSPPSPPVTLVPQVQSQQPPQLSRQLQSPQSAQDASREHSRSPNLTGSPTSPSEMVIDESADIVSPAASDQDDTKSENK